MKNKLFYLLAVLLLIGVGCKKESVVDTVNVGAEFRVYNDGVTPLDKSAQIVVVDVSKDKTLSKSELTVKNLGVLNADGEPIVANYKEDLGTLTFTDSIATLNVSREDLGLTKPGQTAVIEFTAKYNGHTIVRQTEVSYTSAIDIKEEPTLYGRDPKNTSYLKFSISSVNTKIDSKKLEVSVNGGSFTECTLAYDEDKNLDSSEFDGIDYNAGDTLKFRITGTAGSLTETANATVVVGMWTFDDDASFTLDSTSNKSYDLFRNKLVPSSLTDSADMAWESAYSATTGVDVGFKPENGAEFIQLTDHPAETFDTASVLTTQNYDFSSPLTDVPAVAVGDVFAYHITRGSKETYGLLKVTAVDKDQADKDRATITFEHKSLSEKYKK